MNDFAIRTEDLSKVYRIGVMEERRDTLAGSLVSLVHSPIRNFKRLRSLTTFDDSDAESSNTIWALRNVCIEVKEGETLGIVGSNGAGKTTLLKILSNITEPTTGRALVRGRVASLLEVGTGFHPELTGRENVYLNGTILGMTKVEIDKKFDEIVSFSGVENFIDTPVKRFSAGMKVRLAFAVAAHLEPEILLVDEVLAVGDAEFQKKCLGRMDTVTKEGRTVLFVSHNLAAVASLCRRGILVSNGAVSFHGGIGETISQYQRVITRDSEPDRSPNSHAGIEAMGLIVESCEEPITPASPLNFRWRLQIRKPQWEVKAQLILYNSNGSYVAMPLVDSSTVPDLKAPGIYECHLRFPTLWLNPGSYFAKVKMWSETTERSERFYSDTINFLVSHEGGPVGREQLLAPECEWLIRPVA